MIFTSGGSHEFCSNAKLIENVIKGLNENKDKEEITIKLKYSDLMWGEIKISKMIELGMGIIGPCSIETYCDSLKMEYNFIYKKIRG